MVGRALSRAHHSSVWTASSLRVFMYGHGEHFCPRTAHALHVCIRYSYGGRFGTVRFRPSFPPTSWCARARTVRCPGSVAWCARSNCRVVLVMYADHERCVCALLCASGVALHNLCGFETIQNFSGEWMIIYHAPRAWACARAYTHRETAALARIRPPHETFSSQVNLVSDSPSCAWERDWTGCRHLAHAKRAHEVIPVAGHCFLLALLGEFLEQAGPLRLNFLGGTALLTSCLHSRAEIP